MGKLLEGYAQPQEPLSQQLAAMEAKLLAAYKQAALERRALTDDLQRLRGEAAAITRRVLRALTDEAMAGPRLFTLSPIPIRRQEPTLLDLLNEKLLLTLWCEHPGHEHPLGPAGQYRIHNPHQWVTSIAPWALISLKVLRIVAPIAAGAIGLAEESLKNRYGASFEFMEKLADSIDELKPEMEAYATRVEDKTLPYAPFSRAEGESLRPFHDLLREVGWQPGAANLRRVTDKVTGDILWVCPEH